MIQNWIENINAKYHNFLIYHIYKHIFLKYYIILHPIKPMYGLNSKDELRFQPIVGQDIYYADDEELSLDDLINTPLPPVPLDVTFTGN